MRLQGAFDRNGGRGSGLRRVCWITPYMSVPCGCRGSPMGSNELIQSHAVAATRHASEAPPTTFRRHEGVLS